MKNIVLNNNGNITFLGILSTLIITTLFTITASSNYSKYKYLKANHQLHLCRKYIQTTISTYNKKMRLFNKSIKATYLLTLLPQSKLSARAVLPALKKTQDLYHFSNMKKILFNNYCRLPQQLMATTKLPYLTNSYLVLKRDKFHQAKKRNSKWEIKILPRISNINILRKFITLSYPKNLKEHFGKEVNQEQHLLRELSGSLLDYWQPLKQSNFIENL